MAGTWMRGVWAWRTALLLWVLVLSTNSARADTFVPALRSPTGSVSHQLLEQIDRAGKAARARETGQELHQSLVVPTRPGRNNVRYYGFEWERYDYLDDRGVGGVRFYYYGREREVAKISAALVREQYELLSRKFNYRPTQRVPYILYNSHREFENTNVFFVNEYILGVTSPLDLRMALPYWGEINLFRQVSTHEMTHQFQIQKMSERAAAAGVESAINKVPLWFTEGIAEYYSRDGIDLETDMFARDILLNPRPDKGYALPSFWEESQPSYIYTYKLGQLRVAFLADTYGEKIIQGILDLSPRLSMGSGFASDDEDDLTFKGLLTRITGDKPDALAQRFSAWMKRRYLPSYLSSKQEPPYIPQIEIEGEPDAFSAAPDGNTILYRSVDRESGRSRLFLADRRQKGSAVQVAVDGVPGVESLYPVLRSVTAIAPTRLAFFARHGASDGLFIVPYTRTEQNHRVEMHLGERKEIDLTKADIIEAGDPTFSPNEDRVAFFALDRLGRIDIWTAEVATGKLARLTDSLYAERDLHWSSESPDVYGVEVTEGGGKEGTLIYTADETEDRRYNLFAMDPSTGKRRRLIAEPSDERTPLAIGNGQIVYSSDAQGKVDLHLYDAKTKTTKRLTDFETSLTSPARGPDGLMAVGFFGGQYRIFDVPKGMYLSLDERPAIVGEPEAAAAYQMEPIPDPAPRYEPFAANNWRLQNGIAAIGTASYGQGALLFGDTLSDHNVLLQFAMYGSPELTDALVFYFDRSHRHELGLGLFHTFTQRRDVAPPGFSNSLLFLQREFGGQGLWSYPIDSFTRVEAHASIEGVQRTFLFPVDNFGNVTSMVNLDGLRTWNDARAGFDLQGEASLSFGYDTTRFQWPAGAAGGGSIAAEMGGGILPLRGQPFGYASLDTQYHLKIFFFGVLHFRLAAGIAGGSDLGKQFWLSSYDNLRGYLPFDIRLIGTTYAVGNLNFDLPLDAIIRLAFITNVKGIIGLDIGGVAARPDKLWSNRTMDWVLGVNLGLGPFEIRIQFADAIDIGAGEPNAGWVPNISLQYAYF